jgi:hypothetical protein
LQKSRVFFIANCFVTFGSLLRLAMLVSWSQEACVKYSSSTTREL